jgi:hypothetical protein
VTQSVLKGPDDEQFTKAMDDLIKRNVLEQTYTAPGNHGYNYGYGYLPQTTKNKQQTGQSTGLMKVEDMIKEVTAYDKTMQCYVFSDNSHLAVMDIDMDTQDLLDKELERKILEGATT